MKKLFCLMCVLFCGAVRAEQCAATDGHIITDRAYCPDGHIEVEEIDAAKACDDIEDDQGEKRWVCIPDE
jgi:hypothetical protein